MGCQNEKTKRDSLDITLSLLKTKDTFVEEAEILKMVEVDVFSEEDTERLINKLKVYKRPEALLGMLNI